MRSFYHIVLALFAVLLFSPAGAEEPRFVPQVDVAAIKTSSDVYHAKEWAGSRRYERKQEINSAHYDKKQFVQAAAFDRRLEALKVVREANYEAYLQWLDARELMDFERLGQIERSTPEFKKYHAAVEEINSARDQEVDVLEAERNLVLAEIEEVYDAEIKMIEEAYAKVEASQ